MITTATAATNNSQSAAGNVWWAALSHEKMGASGLWGDNVRWQMPTEQQACVEIESSGIFNIFIHVFNIQIALHLNAIIFDAK